MPADPRLYQEIVLLGSVSADLAERNVQTFGTNAGGLGQHLTEIAFTKSEAAKPSERSLLSVQSYEFNAVRTPSHIALR